MKNFQIIAVRTIFTTDRPVVVFELAGAPAILRAPKLALIDLQNSGRALKLPSNCLDGGLAYMHPAQKEVFIQALLGTVGATLSGEIDTLKAGDTYVVTKGHPALTDPTHKGFGVKEGGTLVTEKGGQWVNGFLSIPFTPAELMRKEIADASAVSIMAMFGFGAIPMAQSAPALNSAPVTVEVSPEQVDADVEAFATADIATGKK